MVGVVTRSPDESGLKSPLCPLSTGWAWATCTRSLGLLTCGRCCRITVFHRGRQEPGGTREEQTLRQGGHICSLVHWVLSALEGQAGKQGLQRGHLGASAFSGAHDRERFEERAAPLTPRREEVRRGSASCPALRRPHTAHSGTWRQRLRRPRKPRGGTSLHSLVLLVQRGTGL